MVRLMSTPIALADLDWHEDAVNMIAAYAASGLTFCADDLRRSMRPAPNPNDVGNAFAAARQRGIITATGYTESTAPSRRRGVIRVWRGNKERA